MCPKLRILVFDFQVFRDLCVQFVTCLESSRQDTLMYRCVQNFDTTNVGFGL